jgi:hypothetical protein
VVAEARQLDAGTPGVVDSLIEGSRELWGERWMLAETAFAVVVSERRARRRGPAVELLDETVPLLRRIRYARTRSGSQHGRWWNRQIETATDELQIMLAVTAALLWTSRGALQEVLPVVERHLKDMDVRAFGRVSSTMRSSSWFLLGSAATPLATDRELSRLTPRALGLLSLREPRQSRGPLRKRLLAYKGRDAQVLAIAADAAAEFVLSGSTEWEGDLKTIRRAYRLTSGAPEGAIFDLLAGPTRGQEMPTDVAHKVLRQPKSYPLWVVAAAEAHCRTETQARVARVGSIAKKARWFKP